MSLSTWLDSDTKWQKYKWESVLISAWNCSMPICFFVVVVVVVVSWKQPNWNNRKEANQRKKKQPIKVQTEEERKKKIGCGKKWTYLFEVKIKINWSKLEKQKLYCVERENQSERCGVKAKGTEGLDFKPKHTILGTLKIRVLLIRSIKMKTVILIWIESAIGPMWTEKRALSI